MMKKTLIGLTIIGMMLATIVPLNLLVTSDSAQASSIALARSTVRGLAIRIGHDATGRYTRLFAIRLHFVTVTADGHHENGVIWLKKVEIPVRALGFHGRLYIYASFLGSIQQYP